MIVNIIFKRIGQCYEVYVNDEWETNCDYTEMRSVIDSIEENYKKRFGTSLLYVVKVL